MFFVSRVVSRVDIVGGGWAVMRLLRDCEVVGMGVVGFGRLYWDGIGMGWDGFRCIYKGGVLGLVWYIK